jgi:UDP-MurNAc hydroxylase
MELEFLGAASLIIHSANNTTILCDPWFDTPAFVGSWLPFPKLEYDYSRHIDYIYISHIHSDHFDLETLSKFDKSTKFLIYKFDNPFLHMRIKSLGFENVYQLSCGEQFPIDESTYVKIYGPTECDSFAKQDVIDTSLLVTDGEYVLLNFNDNIYELRDEVLKRIEKEHPNVDLLCHGYTSASSYPQCTVSLSEEEMLRERDRVTELCLKRSEKLIEYINPSVFMPFAGFYVLCGELSHLNKFKANLHPYEALLYYRENMPHLLEDRSCLIMNVNETYCLKTENLSKPYVHYEQAEMDKFIESSNHIQYPYQHRDINNPTLTDLLPLLEKAYNRMNSKRADMGFSTETKILVKLPDGYYLDMSMAGAGYGISNNLNLHNINYVMMEVDFRLLHMLLKGPKYAHWDNADHGSHIKYNKSPNLYEKGIYHLMCYFHA